MSKPQSAADPIGIEWRGHVAIVTMTATTQRLTNATREALLSTLRDLDSETSRCRAIVLTSAGGTFCAGGHEEESAGPLALSLFRALAAGRRPVVAAVEGLAAGPGLSLAAACDYVIATQRTQFSCSFGTAGLLPEGGIYWSLARRIGAGRARQALLSGRLISGEHALQIGLANELAAPGEALEKAAGVAARYAVMPPVAMAALKAAMATGSDTLDQAIETETNVQPLLRFTRDHNEAVQAFLQKRAPHFVGQ
ncbi:enoyl-CoA hydratase/isomerase family protein [Rhizobium sp. C4]|uniref:enoyl-CoA hydratase/isomerase family protein n=1 Tax=Rhizobium sp. C4 TaxID=1349800 RepID=UPI001E3B4A73|nr:enoyl-CoA hydratase/isomerase family protein [Rhizobium sp. C4]MCD2172229.1 enoyl-CoA hydratase/isomerase family protein [Rhizobium sp. C4]